MPSSGGRFGAESVEQCGHRGLVGGIGGDLDQRRPRRRQAPGQFMQARAGVSRYRDDRRCPHVGELLDQVRADVAGRADDKVAGVDHRAGRLSASAGIRR